MYMCRHTQNGTKAKDKGEAIHMQIFLDAVCIIIIIFAVIRGYRRGFVKTAFKLLLVIAALVIANRFCTPLANYVKSTEKYITVTETLRKNVTDSIYEKFSASVADSTDNATGVQNPQQNSEQNSDGQVSSGAQDTDTGAQNADISASVEKDAKDGNGDFLTRILSVAGVDTDEIAQKYKDSVQNGAQNAAQSTSEAIDELIVTPAAEFICKSLCFIALFIVSVIALNLLMLLLDLIFRLPVLKSMNRAMGAAAGAVSGIIKVFIFCTVVEILLLYVQLPDIGFVAGIDGKTVIFSEFLKFNPLSFLY